MKNGFTLIELIISTLLSVFIALSIVYFLNISLRILEQYKKHVDGKKIDYLIYIIQRQLIGCHNIEFKDGINYLTADGLTKEFIKVFFNADEKGFVYTERDIESGELLYSYKIPIRSTYVYDGRKVIKLYIENKEYFLFVLCAENIPIFNRY